MLHNLLGTQLNLFYRIIWDFSDVLEKFSKKSLLKKLTTYLIFLIGSGPPSCVAEERMYLDRNGSHTMFQFWICFLGQIYSEKDTRIFLGLAPILATTMFVHQMSSDHKLLGQLAFI